MQARTARQTTRHPAAADARLVYVSDEAPAIRRVFTKAGFRYVDARGKPVRAPAQLARIASLAIPPAWTHVWICADERGHIQATGRDARGRKQYRYHPRWRQLRDRAKFEQLAALARALPRIRRAVERDLRGPTLSRDKVLAVVVRLLEVTRARVGNDEYARANEHYGLTTLRDRHAAPTRGGLRLRFVGKSGKPHDFTLDDARLVRLVRRCQELPGQRLFQYQDDDGTVRAIGSGDVNEYLRRVSGLDVTAKDLRTWAGTVMVAGCLLACPPPASATAAKRAVIEAIDAAAAHLRNTRAVCRSSYVHPEVLAAFERGALRAPGPKPPRGLEPLEAATLRILEAATTGRAERRAA